MLIEYDRIDILKKNLKALLPDSGEIKIEHGITAKFINGFPQIVSCYFFYMDNPQASQSFYSLDELELYVHRKIHALKLLTVVTPTPEERWRKDCLRRWCGIYEEREMN